MKSLEKLFTYQMVQLLLVSLGLSHTPSSPIFIMIKSTHYKIYHGNHFNTSNPTAVNIFIMP